MEDSNDRDNAATISVAVVATAGIGQCIVGNFHEICQRR